jgi:nitrogen fixation NifU-like protein
VTDENCMNDQLDELVENMIRILESEDAKIYSEEVIAEFRSPSNVGRMVDADGEGVADGLCKDTMDMWIKVRDGLIVDCTFFTDGCGATIACGSRLTRFVKGMSTNEAMRVRSQDLVSLLNGLPPDHEHCAALAIMAFKDAVRDCEKRRSADAGRVR